MKHSGDGMIKSLNLSNFKCFDNQSIEFGSLTLLSGLNGTGKTSVLQALLLLRQSYQSQLWYKTGSLVMNGNLLKMGAAKDVLYKDAGKPEITIALENGVKNEWKFNYVYGNYIYEEEMLEQVAYVAQTNIFKCSLFTDKFQYLQAGRADIKTISQKLKFIGKNKICNSKLAHPGVEYDILNPQVEAWLGQICPGTRLHITNYKNIDSVDLQYSSAKKQGRIAQQYRVTNTGFGITHVLPTIVALLSACPNALIFLENPEAYLHPKGQTKIGELIARAASCGIQVVVETHSDHVLNAIRLAINKKLLKPEQTYFHHFERDEYNGAIKLTTPKINKDGHFEEWPKGFFDEWVNSLFEL